MKLSFLAIAILGTSLVPSAAIAQAAPAAAAGPSLVAGVTVYDPQGAEVGKIQSVSGENVILDTGVAKALLPKSAFGAGAKGPSVNATKAQVEQLVAAADAKADAAFDAALIPGAEVRGRSGALVGTIKEVTGEQILLDRPTGPVSLTKKAFALGPAGLTISLTAAELEAAAKAGAPQAQSAPASAS
jgi:hypothetical protein